MDFYIGLLACSEEIVAGREEHTEFFVCVQIIHSSPGIVRAPGDQTAGFVVDSRAGDLVPEIEFLQQPAGHEAVEEVDTPPCGDAEDVGIVGSYCEAVELAGAERPVDGVFDDGMARAEIPPPNLAVLRGGR